MATTEYYRGRGNAASSACHDVDGRTRHYGEFYQVSESPVADSRQILLVWGNCQAEALRIVLSSSPDVPFRTVRVPPVHELTLADMPFVEAIVGRADVLVSQPVRSGYRGLPIGTADLLAPPTGPSTSILWPVVRYGGLFPFQVIVRHPDSPAAVPPGVPYHDLRTVRSVHSGVTGFDEWDVEIGEERLRAAAEWSVDQLQRREVRDCDIGISDVLLALGDRAAHTINHPGNDVLIELGDRILTALGAAGPADLDRELLGNIRAPLEKRVVDALGVNAQTRDTWIVGGNSVGQEEIHAVQSRWYRDHPEFISSALGRYGELVEILGLTV